MLYNRLTESVAENRRYERLVAKVVRQGSDIEYLAMMADVTLPNKSGQSEDMSSIEDSEETSEEEENHE